MEQHPDSRQNQSTSTFSTGSEQSHTQDYTRPPEQRVHEPVFGIVSLVLGILSIVLSCGCCPLVGVPFGIAAIVSAILDRVKNDTFGGVAIAGLICGIFGIAGMVLLFLFGFASVFLSGLQFMM